MTLSEVKGPPLRYLNLGTCCLDPCQLWCLTLPHLLFIKLPQWPPINQMKHFWSIEVVGTETSTTSPDMTFLQTNQQSSISQTSDGVYVASFLGGKKSHTFLQTSPHAALIIKPKKMHFRLSRFARSNYIEKAFMLYPSDRDFTWFLWPSSPENSDKLQTAVIPFKAFYAWSSSRLTLTQVWQWSCKGYEGRHLFWQHFIRL